MQLLPEPVRRLAAWCAVILLVSGVVYIGIRLGMALRPAVIPVLLALLGTALLLPLHRWLVRMKVHRSLAAALTCAAVLGAVGGAVYVVTIALVDTWDQIVASLRRGVRDLADQFGASGTSLEELADQAASVLGRFGGTAASGVVSGVSWAVQALGMAVLALLLVFFFLRDSDRATGTLRSLVPHDNADAVEAMARRAFESVEGFMRGTTVVALIDAVCITAGLLILGVPGALGLGALVFIGAYVPYLGAFTSGAVAVLVALADRGLVIALWALGVVLVVQMLEGNIFQPMVQSRTVRIHPAVVLVALTAGASVAGVMGVLLAVPVTAAAFGVGRELRARYASPPGPAPAGPATGPSADA
ncbi:MULTISPECIES: AI-2E family transporter [Streptomyces]|uniref:AI-2E family transporter n=2 Tax=Streptomyces TaxID=1883 RepID=A0A3R7IVS1_9ACTN|nr:MULTISPECIES: AI-2E family transporter [Streptomyces]KNE83478.1 membrane protein [Streptomyces fradiae]OFA61961.1 AI-2E family transporter [Streptomyces fradiae]PQM24282.1 AI-2E family transporter [Streptomyces xinghaiensis]RKM97249.1 AI-2E family transporter [Streptomyces xinghaiensis]RNC75356.1 AI-2E family transporter [Streptomyces xinghaiensis]